ncbi:uncharacterized protein LOC105439494 [Strongylocentrotus purpuratus]|uniref:EGF-like domain-containing protein n=1 Tax=Strongylocentrotus purpuratus TaxID=7668 RepID=A0A7M7N0V8_STRPU|nr:uncharacterized protein LOC105439494 [Strongylocentrotus purpuratus]
MAIRLHIALCGFLLALSRVIHASNSNNITLTPTNSQVSFRFNSSEPFCDPPICDYNCDIYVTSPPGTILNATFLALHVPEDDKMTIKNLNTNEVIGIIDWISSVIDPIFLDSSQMKIEFDRCDGSSPYSYLEAEFSFTDQLQDSFVRSSAGAFALSDTYPSITIQSVNLSSLTDVAATLHWFITASSYTWIQVDILDMNPGEGGEVCIFDTFDTYGEWVCMRDSVSSTTWYSYDDEIKMSFYVNGNSQLGAGLTVKLSIVDHSTWNGQFLTLAACNPNVIVQEVETISFVTPYFNQSLENVRYQCRMSFTNGDPLQPTSLEYNHFDVPGEVSVFTVESGQFVNLADATDIKVDISPDSPIVSISPTHELEVDVTTGKYNGTGIGMMVQPYTGDTANRGPEPMSSFGVAIELDDNSYLQEFTTLGYPTLPEGDINIRWLFDKPITDTAIKVEFIDFDIGAATLFGHIAETAPPPWEFTGSTLPDDIRTETQRLTLLLRSDIVCCKRGIHFNVTLITLNNECLNSPCNNGGTCYDDLESFRCICPTGYIGDLCQNLITTAGSSPQTSPQSSTTVHVSREHGYLCLPTSLPPDRPPEYETIPPLKEGGAHGGDYLELDSSAIGGVDYEKLREDKAHSPGNRNPPEYASIIPVGPAQNRDSQYSQDYIEPISSIPMSGTTYLPSGVNPEQTTTFHR